MESNTSNTFRDCDVIVIGGGISGLSAAKWLKDSGIVNVIVLEARDRVGGRTFTKRNLKCKYVDVGGAYVGPTQDYVLRLSKELGIETYKINAVEDVLHYRNGIRHRFREDGLPSLSGILEVLDYNNLFRTIDKMGSEIPNDAPWNAPHAQQWDLISVKEFLHETCWTKHVREIGELIIHVMTAEAYEASLLWFLWYIKQCDGAKRIYGTINAAQERKFIGGSQQISKSLHALLGDQVLLNKPVVEISYQQQTSENKHNVTVRTLDGSEFKSKYVILAFPPALQQKIHFNPQLPPLRNQLIQRYPMGCVMKCVVYYKTTFWRSKGYCGSMLIEGNDDHPIMATYDDTKPDGSHPAILGFMYNDKALRLHLLTEEERKNLICKSFATAMDAEDALYPIHYEEFNWIGEQYSGGCFTGMCPPGFLTRFGRLVRDPIDDSLFFAGTETATQWNGYMDGAVSSGERAAREVLCSMGKISKDKIWVVEPLFEECEPFGTTFLERNLPSVPGFFKIISFISIVAVSVGFCIAKKVKYF